jgi:hypothetical protein
VRRRSRELLRDYPELIAEPGAFHGLVNPDVTDFGVDYSQYVPSKDFESRRVYDWSDKTYPSETWHLAQFVSVSLCDRTAVLACPPHSHICC